MNNTLSRVALLTFSLLGAIAAAEPLPEDALLDAMDEAGKALAQEADRQETVDQLNLAIKQNTKSRFLAMAKSLSADLVDSVKKTKAEPPEKLSLMESKLGLNLMASPQNWKQIPKFIESSPDDPLARILKEGRPAIEALLPLLRDRSPTRGYENWGISGELPIVPRVCDAALLTIEYFSQCRFHMNAFTRKRFHELPPEDRDQTIGRIETWWRDNQEQSLAEGIRAQLPHAEFYEQLEMANNLARLEDPAQDNPDRAYAIEVMRKLARENWGSKAARAADSMARLGDLSAVEDFYRRWQTNVRKPDTESTYIASFLLAHGGRREWEFFHTLAVRQIEQGREDGAAEIWPLLIHWSKTKRNTPYMIPGLALALTKTRREGARFVEGVGSQEFSRADTAAEGLQKLTGEDFGYRRDDTADNRSAAIERAQEWWQNEGRQKYTFDYLETLLEQENPKDANQNN